MRRNLSLLLFLAMTAALFTGCGGVPPDETTDPDSGTLQVVVTVFPAWDWLREIAGDCIDLTLLTEGGVDLHSYQPSVDDMVKLSGCDLAVYVGGESDAWAAEALKNAGAPGPQSFSLMEALGDAVKEEALVEGMEAEAENGETEYDEHVWLSLKNAGLLCQSLCDCLVSLDPDNRETYEASTAAYLEKLRALDSAYADAVANGSRNTLLFGDRFPFRYMTDDYGLTYYAAFSGCSAETEASFETVIFLAGKVDELELPVILQIETSDGSIAKTVSENTKTKDQKLLTLDSMQAASGSDAYLSIMERNLEVLKQALS